MNKWIGKLAVVTGGSSGIGAAIVKDFAKAGINVVALARREERLKVLAEELKDCPGKVYSHVCDVSNKESTETAFKWIEESFGTLNILVNNAGIVTLNTILNEDEKLDDVFQKTMDTNFNSVVRCSRLAFKLMKKSDDYGYIININSITGHRVPVPLEGAQFSNVYPSTKFAITAVTEILRQELICMKNDKIRVSSLSPGVVKTEILGELADCVYKQYPHMKEDDISQAVMYILSTPYNVNVTELTIQAVGELL